jgi:hypothetical protein
MRYCRCTHALTVGMAPEKLYFQNAMSCRFDTKPQISAIIVEFPLQCELPGNVQMESRPRSGDLR